MLAIFLSLALLLSRSSAVRNLKDGPVVDKDGREYKSVGVDENDVTSEGRQPVQVTCTERSMIIEVTANVFGSRQLVSPGELFLGGAEHSGSRPCQALPDADGNYIIKAGLLDCGTQLSLSDDSVIYSNHLTFSPRPRHVITRLTEAVIPVSCHYRRRHVVSSHPQDVPPIISSPTNTSPFSLKLMSDDWTRPRLSNVFHLGDFINIEASYINPGPEQRQLFIDSCVATLSPDSTSVPRYFFIENNGCLSDSKLQASRSHFLSRRRVDVVQLQLDAFRFQRDERNSIFITCQLKASSEMWRSSPVNKACSYVHSRWINVDESDEVCSCCESTCSQNFPKKDNKDTTRHNAEGTVICDTTILGPLVILPTK
ncbi:zona pellucida sperm-binding protein 3-like [Nerophis ophidion]|uniref:zona pellucida sperm-binding protein 3-like n=1 Tax=Nerophis ophidion TaxID=159077 RepID=UPI002AE0B0B7|nr:zona pellucida sperm-binding protein 3-like [Nerophis ophidion]XP_061741013.1 zona pellucida sperm-binding protein 3-like [Nerophis ophidion]